MISTIQKKETLSNNEKEDRRGVLAYPKIDEFHDTLMDRLHMVLSLFFEDKFTIFINSLPRDHKPGEKIYIDRIEVNNKLKYSGIVRQVELMGENIDVNLIEDDINFLKKVELTPKNSKVNIELIKDWRKGNTTLNNLVQNVGYLRDYFSSILASTPDLKELPDTQKAEYNLLSNFLKEEIDNYKYLSVPLIQFAEFDGIVHIILSEKDFERIFTYKTHSKSRKPYKNAIRKIKKFNKNEKEKLYENAIEKILNEFLEEIEVRKFSKWAVGIAIQAFSREYEGLILDWDVVGGARLKLDTFNEAVFDGSLYKHNEKDNPILKELKYREYYKLHENYFKMRIQESLEVPSIILAQYRTIAVLHILLDSYSHNISAHSLTALEWWFKLRADKKSLDSSFNSNIALLKNREIPLDKDIHPLLRFFLDKGAFWTGLTRDYSFGGQIKSLYRVLWFEFINNPLYLGTIAFTEGILKINIYITFLSVESNHEGVEIQKKVELNELFAQIDLTQFNQSKEKVEKSIDEEESQITNFVHQGKHFNKIRSRLRKCKAFFPAGVVGVHAFFTILENELRNVKHYSKEALTNIQKNGLSLNISIEETSYETKKSIEQKQTHYYKIGVWLKHPINLTKKLLLLRPQKLDTDIMQKVESTITQKANEYTLRGDIKDFRPKLGGTYQDKVCAAMLFNSSFNKIEDDTSPLGKQFYPWVKAGFCTNMEYKEGDEIDDWELSARRILIKEPRFQASRAHFEKRFQPSQGYYKKFFHLWKGENIYHINDFNSLNNKKENIARFRFVYLSENNKLGYQKIREAGIIRIIHTPAKSVQEAYLIWLNRWLKKDDQNEFEYRVDFTILGDITAQLKIGANQIVFRNKKIGLEDTDPQYLHFLNIKHKGEEQHDENGMEAIRYRSHGIFRKYFLKKTGEPGVNFIPEKNRGELLEYLGTRVCIFDNRVAKRFEGLKKEIIEEQLLCYAHTENFQAWETEKQNDFFRHHFLVVHLSFIEALGKQPGKRNYQEDNIITFLDDEILQGRTPPENFIVVIITGRGRTLWWNNLKDYSSHTNHISYTSFVTFRSVETMTTAIENALALPDDMELKYRLVKILFGS